MSENSLSAAIAGNLEAQEKQDAPPPAAPKATSAANDRQRTGKAAAKRKPSRVDTVLVGGHFPRSVNKQLKIIAAEDETTVQALIEEALNLLFAKKGRAKITELS